MRLRTLALATIAVAALGLAQAPTNANAAEQARKPIHRTEKGKAKAKARAKATAPRHCVQSVSTPRSRMTCYDTFTKAIVKATGGRITDAPADVRVAMRDRRLLTRLNATGTKKRSLPRIRTTADFAITTLFDEDSFQGSSLTYTADHNCTGPLNNIDFADRYFGDDMNDMFESYRTFANCFVRLWEHRDWRGSMLDFAGDRTDFGILHDEVSSIQWS